MLPVKKYVIEQEIMLPRATVWELLGNTDHLNRVIGLPAVRFNNVEHNTNGLYRRAAARVMGGIALQWKEYPFQWVKNVGYDVVRVYEKGPLSKFRGGVTLSDSQTMLPDGSPATNVCVFSEFTPAHPLGYAAIYLVGKKTMRNTVDYLLDFLAPGKEGVYLPQPLKSRTIGRVEANRFQRLLEKLGQFKLRADLISKFKNHLAHSSDDEVVAMKPYTIAARWNADRDEVLSMFLYATSIGITNLSWHLICPNCRVSKHEVNTLGQLNEQIHCDFCEISYDANLDKYVELRFSVHSQIRTAHKDSYCIGGPAYSPHVYSQSYIARGESTEIRLPGGQDNQDGSEYRLRVLRSGHSLAIMKESVIHGGNSRREVMYGENGWEEKDVSIAINPNETVVVCNRSPADIVAVVEQTAWDDDAVTAAKVMTMSEFRKLFSSEVLSPGREVGIESVALMFTDLLNSTAYYEQVGDAPAYGQVRQHFDYMAHWVHKHRGTFVKTMGDAVMAAFPQPLQAFQAALDVQKHLPEYNAGRQDAITIKIGLHYGPAVAVNADNILDYFGRTVNVAARIQSLSAGNDVVVSAELLGDESVQEWMESENCRLETFEVSLKGIAEQYAVARITVGNDVKID